MISETHAKKFCEEDISLIENYEQAVNDKNNKCDCHPRLGEQYSRKYLIENGLYKKRPASELIFILEEEHRRFHNNGRKASEDTKKKMAKSKIGNKYRLGKSHSEKTKKKMSESQIGNHSKPTKSVLQYTKEGEFIREWKSATEAGRTLGIYQSSISRCCRGKLKSVGSFVWKFSESK